MDTNSRPGKINSYRDESFLRMVENLLILIIEEDRFKEAFDLSLSIKEFISRKKNELEKTPEIFTFYKKALVSAEFIALPLLDNNEVVDLLKNHFTDQFSIPFYDLVNKFRSKIVNIEVFEERDVLRQEIKKNLLTCGDLLTGGTIPPRTISEWLKDYNVKLGIGQIDSLKRSQYFLQLGKAVKRSEKDEEKIKVLLDLYEETKLSSLDPNGYDYDVPIIFDDQLNNYKRGLLERLSVDKNNLDKINNILEGKSLQEAEAPLPRPVRRDLVAEAEAEANEKELAHLKELLENYPAKSLERKAIEGEINKLSKK